MSGIREGRWNCPCKRVNLARFEKCQGCGRGRGIGTPFYLPEGEGYISDEELLSDALSGSDWHCNYCDISNKAASSSCSGCGNPRTEDDRDHDASIDVTSISSAAGEDLLPTKPAREKTAERRQRYPSSWEDASHTEGHSLSDRSLQKTRETSPNRFAKIARRSIFAGIFVTFVFALFYSFAVDNTAKSQIEELSWSRQITIETLKTLEEDGWDLPSGAYAVTTEQRQRTTKTVTIGFEKKTTHSTERKQTGSEPYTCGTESLGNGYFRDKTCYRQTYTQVPVSKTVDVPITKEVPVMDTWYRFKIDRWTYQRSVEAKGSVDTPYWPAVTLGIKEREGRKDETYSAKMTIEDDSKAAELSLQEWSSLSIGDEVVVVTDFWGRVKDVSKTAP